MYLCSSWQPRVFSGCRLDREVVQSIIKKAGKQIRGLHFCTQKYLTRTEIPIHLDWTGTYVCKKTNASTMDKNNEKQHKPSNNGTKGITVYVIQDNIRNFSQLLENRTKSQRTWICNVISGVIQIGMDSAIFRKSCGATGMGSSLSWFSVRRGP